MSIKNFTPLELLEIKVTKFLQEYANNDYSKDIIAPNVAKKSLMPNHLYEDLGLRNRFEMGHYMSKYFPALSKK
ncbi:MAG: nitrogen fixation protein NifQ [Campylobacterota bacterium]|nr:nitrogen fixation protein NifQ [Campylobacterota bacterium]